MSKRHPSRSAVRLMPPTTVSASRTVDVTPRLVSTYAAVRPAGPAPMMTTLGEDGDSVVTKAAPSLAPSEAPALRRRSAKPPPPRMGGNRHGPAPRAVPFPKTTVDDPHR